jgi:DNA-binding PadR family transcriptional regulator
MKGTPMNSIDISKYLPLTESTYYIMLALVEPRHGYAIMQEVEKVSGGTVTIGPGTMYGAFSNLEKEKLIFMERQEGRRKVYALTDLGRKVLSEQIARLETMTQVGAAVLPELQAVQS